MKLFEPIKNCNTKVLCKWWNYFGRWEIVVFKYRGNFEKRVFWVAKGLFIYGCTWSFFMGKRDVLLLLWKGKYVLYFFQNNLYYFSIQSFERKNCSILVLGNSNFFDPFEEGDSFPLLIMERFHLVLFFVFLSKRYK